MCTPVSWILTEQPFLTTTDLFHKHMQVGIGTTDYDRRLTCIHTTNVPHEWACKIVSRSGLKYTLDYIIMKTTNSHPMF